MKKKVISILLSSVMAMSVLAGCGGSDAPKEEDKKDEAATNEGSEEKSEASDDTLVYWSMWESTEPQGKVIQEAVDAYVAETGVKVDLQFKGRTGNREALQPA